MQVAVSEAKGLLLELVRKAEGGEEIILTRHGHAISRIVGIAPGAATRRAALEEARGAATAGTAAGAARGRRWTGCSPASSPTLSRSPWPMRAWSATPSSGGTRACIPPA